MLRKLFFFLIAVVSFSSATAGSIRLINDSIYTLKAIIYANDDSTVGELILEPEKTKYWSDLWGEEGYTEGEQGVYRNYRYSRSPYRVVLALHDRIRVFTLQRRSYSSDGSR